MHKPPSVLPTVSLMAAVASVVTLLVVTSGPPVQAALGDPAPVSTTHAKAALEHDSRFVRAKQALTRAQEALSPQTPASERPDATVALRDLRLLEDALSPADRAAAQQLVKRPPKPAAIGNAHVLLHYDPAEIGAGFTPQQALDTLAYVSDTYAGSGYRRPKPDGTKGGDSRIDIYLDTLEPGLYGFCDSDQKKARKTKTSTRRPFDVWAYCVLDNDYASFSSHTPLENLQVTAAHEYFHAVQFAYDYAEDGWFLEATAAWAEDEVYTAINDNVQFLEDSHFTFPGTPLDTSNLISAYGAWIYFRYLTEHFPAETGTMPGLVLRMWEYADSSKASRRDRYSTQAIAKALRRSGYPSLATTFAGFSAATRVPSLFSEGVANSYPVKKLRGRAHLQAGEAKGFQAPLDHLTSATYRFRPGRRTSTLRLAFAMAPRSQGSRAMVMVRRTDGTHQLVEVRINGRGIAREKVAFGSGVAAVEVTLVNASTRFRGCYTGAAVYTCDGDPVDDDSLARVRGVAG